MSKKLEIKTTISCDKCRTIIMKAVCKLEGVDEISVDVEKQMVTVIGQVNPTKIVKSLKKAGKPAIIAKYGPQETKEEPDKPDPCPCPSWSYSYPSFPYGLGGHYTVYEL